MKSKSITYRDFTRHLSNVLENAKRNLSSENYNHLIKYDKLLVSSSIAESTHKSQLQVIKTSTEMLDKNWSDTTKDDIVSSLA